MASGMLISGSWTASLVALGESGVVSRSLGEDQSQTSRKPQCLRNTRQAEAAPGDTPRDPGRSALRLPSRGWNPATPNGPSASRRRTERPNSPIGAFLVGQWRKWRSAHDDGPPNALYRVLSGTWMQWVLNSVAMNGRLAVHTRGLGWINKAGQRTTHNSSRDDADLNCDYHGPAASEANHQTVAAGSWEQQALENAWPPASGRDPGQNAPSRQPPWSAALQQLAIRRRDATKRAWMMRGLIG